MKIKILLTLAAMAFALQAAAQIYDTNGDYVQTFAGYGEQGYLNGQGLLTKFSNPSQIVADTSSNLYVWDSGNYLIRKITPGGAVSTLAGGGTDIEGPGTNVSFSLYDTIGAMAMDHSNTIWLVAYNDSYPGVTYLLNIQTNGLVSIENGGNGLTNLSTSSGICFDSADNLYFSGNNSIWRYCPASGLSQPFAGNGSSGYVDGSGTVFPEFSDPTSLACDEANNIYVWDSGNDVIRRIDPSQNVSTYAGSKGNQNDADGTGTNATFNSIFQMCCDNSGNLYVVCGLGYYYFEGSSGVCIRKIDAQTNTVTMAGSFSQSGYADGPGNVALFDGADGVCMSGGVIYVADEDNQRIRDITFNPQPQVVGGANLSIGTYPGIRITGVIGRTYQIQSSSDLNNWTTEAIILLTSSPYLWIDQNPIAGNKYYQAVLLP
ncbi:MAG TPA: hypothetical protein VMH30_05545 [Verrucomicrobiae bacterium]|nr:hypothetical protein [Verrucomicrobiae bacterium]